MAGKFINNNQKIMIDSLTKTVKEDILKNEYYMYSDKKGAVADYYNINTTKTTLDEATRANYSELGNDSPIRYNLIKNTFLYGITKMDIDLDIGEYGLEAGEIAGEAIVLPNTFIPYVGDFFALHQIGKPYLFRVTAVNPNTLDTGAIMYKLNYVLAYTDLHGIDRQTVEDYNMMINNVGSNFKAVIKSSKYDLIEEIEKYTTRLKDYYIMLFYNSDVQAFTYSHNGIVRAYDPYLTEFMIRNDILKGSTQYMYVSQQMFLPLTFGVDYDKTIFAALEDGECNSRANIRYTGNLLLITQKLSLLYAYYEDYYYMEYSHLNNNLFTINILGDIDIDFIRENIKTGDVMIDIMIKYFNHEEITFEDLHALKNIDYCSNKELFYSIPITIFCLENIIINLLT